MDIIIESPGFKASNDLQAFVREKLSKLENMGQNIVRADVTLYAGPASDPAGYHCEIRLEVPGNDHFVKKSGETYERAVVETVDTLQQVIRRSKGKVMARRNNSGLNPDQGTDELDPALDPDVD